MTIQNYIDSCNQFAEDTAAWGGLDSYKMYVATEYGGWAETCDNRENGIRLSWAFGLPSVNPEAAKEAYKEAFADELKLAGDDEWDEDQRRLLYEKYEDCVVNSGGHIFCGEWDAIANLMDDEIREELHEELAPCTNQEFFTAYEKAHEGKYGDPWELSKENPVW